LKVVDGRNVLSLAICRKWLLFFRVEDSHDTQRGMAGFAFNLKIVLSADIVKQCCVNRSTDRREVQFHLDASHIIEINGVDQPFCSFTVAFQKITTARYPDNRFESVRWYNGMAPIPADLFVFSISQSPFDNGYSNTVDPDVLLKDFSSDRLDSDDMSGTVSSPDAESSHVCTDIHNMVTGSDIFEPVFGDIGYLTARHRNIRKPGLFTRAGWRRSEGARFLIRVSSSAMVAGVRK
jgi:hypothetical protein